jgi:transcriptional regulator with XRE-family HTH domain
MLRSSIAPLARYANNLRILIALHETTVAQVAAAAGVVPKQVYNILNQSHDARLKGLEKVANVFGLSAWQMLATELSDKPAKNKQVLALLEHFASADEAGQAAIMQVSELAKRA